MNKEKINEVGELLEVDHSEIKKSKVTQIWRNITFPIIQASNFILSSILGLLFGFWENKIPSGYPYSGPFKRIYTFGIPIILSLNSGNVIFSFKKFEKSRLKKSHAILIVILNIVISIASFFLLYIVIENVPPLTGAVEYNTYKRFKNTNFHLMKKSKA